MKQNPWSRFAFWVRWWYPKQEAQDILSDYREMPAPDLSHPWRIIRDLGVSRASWSWLAAFAILTACLIFPSVWLFTAAHHEGLTRCFLLLGCILSFAWFQREEKGAFPAHILPFLGAELVLLCAAGGLLAGALASPQSFAGLGGRFSWFFLAIGIAGAVLGLYGLLKARVSDRRWRAVYILGLTVLSVCICVLSLLHSMTLSEGPWWLPYVRRAAWTGALGLVCTGVALC